MSSTVHEEIVELLRHYVNGREISGLLKNAVEVEKYETGLVSTKSRRRAQASFCDSATLDRSITYCRERLRPTQYAELLRAIGDIFRRYGSLDRAAELYSSIVNSSDSFFGERDVAQTRVRRAHVYSQQGKWKEAIADLSESKSVFVKEGDALSVGIVENTLGTVHAESGNTDEALQCISRALTAFEQAESTELIGTALMNMGIVHNMRDEYDIALSHYTRARSFLEGVGDGTRLAELHHNMGMTYLSRNEFKNASREFDLSLSLGAKQHNMNLLGLAHLGKANVHYRLRDLPTALRLVNKALEPFAASGDRLSIADSYKVKGMIHREMKKYNFAESYLQTSLRMNLELSNRLNAAETYVEIGLLEQKRGNWKEATAAFESAQRYFAMVGALGHAQSMESDLGKLAEGRG